MKSITLNTVLSPYYHNFYLLWGKYFPNKYLSKSFKTLEAETTRHYANDLRRKLVAIVILSVPYPFKEFQEKKHNLAITIQN